MRLSSLTHLMAWYLKATMAEYPSEIWRCFNSLGSSRNGPISLGSCPSAHEVSRQQQYRISSNLGPLSAQHLSWHSCTASASAASSEAWLERRSKEQACDLQQKAFEPKLAHMMWLRRSQTKTSTVATPSFEHRFNMSLLGSILETCFRILQFQHPHPLGFKNREKRP